MQRLTGEALSILKDIILKEREAIKESLVNSINPTADLIEKGKAQMCGIFLAKIEEARKEGNNYGRSK